MSEQAGDGFVEADDRIAESLQHGHLGLEAGKVAILAAMARHPVREMAYPVVHQDVDSNHRFAEDRA